MGFHYRKSINLGPFRINLSKSGVGYSVGGRGFRTGTSASGRRYTNVSIPGTGIGYSTTHSSKGSAKGTRSGSSGAGAGPISSLDPTKMLKKAGCMGVLVGAGVGLLVVSVTLWKALA